MGWEPEVEELEQRRGWAREMGGPENVARHRAQGLLTIRERIARLSDPGTFQEVGQLTGQPAAAGGPVVPAPYVMGLAKIEGRPVAIGGEDFTVKGGISWGTGRRKGGQGGFVEDLAHEYRIPLVNLIDGSGGSVASAKRRGYTIFPGYHGFERSAQLMGEVPVVSAVLGTAAGGPAGRAIFSHWSVMLRTASQIFAAGPPVVERALGEKLTKEELGGAHVAVDLAGTIDNVAESEQHCFAQIRRFLSFLPQNVWEPAPALPCADPPARREEALLKIIPRERRRAYRMHALMELVLDRGSLFEIQPTFGQSVITSLARLGGYPVGVIANNPLVLGGAMDWASARKQGHFIELCDAFHIPLVFLVDVPGFMVGSRAEQQATLREGMRCVYVALQARVPMLTVVVRKCYGMAGMATNDKNGLDFKIAWPSAEWGSLPIEGGVAAAFRRELAASADPRGREQELEAELRAYASPFLTAQAFAVEDVIDPRETRPYLCRFVEAMQGRLKTLLGPTSKAGVRP
ncbi:MAG: propionyl-CoA carboxylase [Candidatus Lambdaproteobacteria bacterium]|nr:propionyl-CoA carboxylase [Candidatus Lambdaproteobacteria bacterium]